jgi:hypothetical protein
MKTCSVSSTNDRRQKVSSCLLAMKQVLTLGPTMPKSRTIAEHPSRGIRLLALFVLIVPMMALAPCYADNITGSEPPDKFGNLKQGDTNCKDVGCGPTAAINSFVFLQNMYPGVYGTSLVPHKDGNTPYQDEIAAADALATYMGCCQEKGKGTYIERFILGKQEYMNKVAPGKTIFAAEDTQAWRPTLPDGFEVGPKPSWVQDNTAPTAQWLVNQLKAGEDVELFINFDGSQNHYVTLTYLQFDTKTDTGQINFIDPTTGKVNDKNYSITGLDPTDKDILIGGYLKDANIVNAVAESPAPEPPSLFLLGSGILGFGGLLRRRLSSRS